MILSCDTPWFYNTIKLGKSRPNGIMLSKSQVTQFHQSFKQLNIIAKKKRKKEKATESNYFE